MGKHETECIDIPYISELRINVNKLNIRYRDDIFFRVYVLKHNAWADFGNWITFQKTEMRKKGVKECYLEVQRLQGLYESISEKGYLYPYSNERDNSITVMKTDRGYNILNGACRMACIIHRGIKAITVREIERKDFCCKRLVTIKSNFNIKNGDMMRKIPQEIKKWIIDFKEVFFSDRSE